VRPFGEIRNKPRTKNEIRNEEIAFFVSDFVFRISDFPEGYQESSWPPNRRPKSPLSLRRGWGDGAGAGVGVGAGCGASDNGAAPRRVMTS
jgi:hypothetical protein